MNSEHAYLVPEGDVIRPQAESVDWAWLWDTTREGRGANYLESEAVRDTLQTHRGELRDTNIILPFLACRACLRNR